MSKQKYYYKVLTCKMKSANGYDARSYNSLLYKLDEWTTPKILNSQLFVFDTLEHAKEYGGERIYKCEVKNPITRLYIASCWFSTRQYKKWWNDPNPPYVVDAPKGTVTCDAVKLIERIW